MALNGLNGPFLISESMCTYFGVCGKNSICAGICLTVCSTGREEIKMGLVINCEFIACNRAQWAWDWLKITWQMSLQKEAESNKEYERESE